MARANPNAENPAKPGHHHAPKTDGRFYLPGANLQPMIDPVTGAIIQGSPKPAPQPTPTPNPSGVPAPNVAPSGK